MFGARGSGKVYNFVHADEIWKAHTTLELQSQKKWSEQWGYLLDEYQKLQESLLDIGEQTMESMTDFEKEQELLENEALTAVQMTTSPEFKIDQLTSALGRCMQGNARGKNDIVKVLKWPREGLR